MFFTDTVDLIKRTGVPSVRSQTFHMTATL